MRWLGTAVSYLGCTAVLGKQPAQPLQLTVREAQQSSSSREITGREYMLLHVLTGGFQEALSVLLHVDYHAGAC